MLVTMAGSDKVVYEFTKIFPNASIYTTVYNEKTAGHLFPKEKVIPSFIQKIPFSYKYYQKLLNLMPKAFESFDLSKREEILKRSKKAKPKKKELEKK